VFHEEPPEDYDEFFTRYAEALYFQEYQAHRIAVELSEIFGHAQK